MENAVSSQETASVSKKEVLLILPYHGSISESFRKSITSLVQMAYKQVQLRVIFRTTCRLSNLFTLKDPIPKRFISNIVYGVYCTGCPKFYVGKTKRHLEKRFKEHKDLRKPTAVTKHLILEDHQISFGDVKVLARGNRDNELLIMESILIKKMKPPLNETVTSYPLELF